MPISLVCSWCDKTITLPDSLAGKTVSCPGCKGIVSVPFEVTPPPGGIGPPPGFDDPPPPASDGASEEAFETEDEAVEPTAPAPPDAEQRRPCPVCGELIIKTAVKCRYCGEVFDVQLRGGRMNARYVNYEDMSGGDWFLAILPCIGCFVAIVYLIQGRRSGGKMLVISIAMTVLWNLASVFLRQMAEVR